MEESSTGDNELHNIDANNRKICRWNFDDVDEFYSNNICPINDSGRVGVIHMLYVMKKNISPQCFNRILTVSGSIKISPICPTGTYECLNSLMSSNTIKNTDYILGVKYGTVKSSYGFDLGKDFQFPITGGQDEDSTPNNTFVIETHEELGLKHKNPNDIKQYMSSYNYNRVNKKQKVSFFACNINEFDVTGMCKSTWTKRTDKTICGIIYGSEHQCMNYLRQFPIANRSNDNITAVAMIRVSDFIKIIPQLNEIKEICYSQNIKLRCMYLNIF